MKAKCDKCDAYLDKYGFCIDCTGTYTCPSCDREWINRGQKEGEICIWCVEDALPDNVKDSQVRCHSVTTGHRDAECLVAIKDVTGRIHHLCVEQDYLNKEGEQYYLPIIVMEEDDLNKMVMVKLPVETVNGFNNIWVNTKVYANGQ